MYYNKGKKRIIYLLTYLLTHSLTHSFTHSLTYLLLQFLSGNWDANSVQYNSLKAPFKARYVRILPTLWYNRICLRVELYGCR